LQIYDFHSHVIPETIIAAMRADPARYGTQIEEREGRRWLLRGRLRLELLPELWSADGKLESMDRKRIDVAVLSPGPQVFFHELPEAEGMQAARLVNDGTAALVAARPARLRGMATLPMQHPDAAVAELERAARELGFRGAEIATTAPLGELADPRYRPLLRRAQELKMTLFAHPNTVGAGAGRLASYYLSNIVGNPLETTIMLSHLIYSGALDELPELKLLLAHGGGFAPYQIGRLVHGHRVRAEARAHTGTSPKQLLKRLYFDTITHDPQALRYLVDLVGADHVLLGSDAPFDMGDEDPVAAVLAVDGLGDEARAMICGGNAMRLLGE
jgi:aminocarboxymuconate-semialdehyde decarboxylase